MSWHLVVLLQEHEVVADEMLLLLALHQGHVYKSEFT
jgi:hypothetical protein